VNCVRNAITLMACVLSAVSDTMDPQDRTNNVASFVIKWEISRIVWRLVVRHFVGKLQLLYVCQLCSV